MQEAFKRAERFLYKLRTDGCCDSFDPIFLAALEIIRSRFRRPEGKARQITAAFIGDLLLEPGDQLTRLKKTVDALIEMNSRHHVLIAYQNVISRRSRLPYLHELEADIRKWFGPSAVPDERTIRFILDKLKLPRNPPRTTEEKPEVNRFQLPDSFRAPVLKSGP